MNKWIALLAATTLMGGCVANDTKSASSAKAEKAETVNNDDYYEVHHEDGRVYVFDDAKEYLGFMEVGEAPFRLTRIGAGPDGKTLVFGLTGKDKKKSADKIAAVNMYEGKLAGADDFYGEIISEGRYYVFNNWKEVEGFRQTGEATFRFTEIGAGPNGMTVVYVLTKKESKKRPDATIAKFKSLHKL
jgi:Tfp pilus assembly protein PilX